MRQTIISGAAACSMLLSLLQPSATTAAARAVHTSSSRRKIPAATVSLIELWRHRARAWGTPAAAAGLVFFMTRDGEVVALSANTGTERWRRRVGRPGDSSIGSHLTVSGNIVAAGEYDLVGLNLDTGTEKWRFVPNNGYGVGIYLGDASASRIYAGSPSGRLYAIDADSGRQQWSVAVAPDKRVTVFSPIVDKDLVIAGFTVFAEQNTGGLIAVDSVSGVERWRRNFPTSHAGEGNSAWAGGPVAHGDSVFAASSDGSIYAFNRGTGSVATVVVEGTSAHQDFRAMAIAGDSLVAGSLSGDLAAYDVSTNHLKWRLRAGLGSVAFAITADDEAAYVPYLSGTLVAVAIADGTERWRTTPAQGMFNWAPRTDRGVVFAGASDSFIAFSR